MDSEDSYLHTRLNEVRGRRPPIDDPARPEKTH